MSRALPNVGLRQRRARGPQADPPLPSPLPPVLQVFSPDGLLPVAYLRSGWNVLDATIVMVSLLSLLLGLIVSDTDTLASLKVLRGLRAFRPVPHTLRLQKPSPSFFAPGLPHVLP